VLVVDTNIVLDLFVFDEPAIAPLKAALLAGGQNWIATSAMRGELVRVLGYPHIAARMQRGGIGAACVLAAFDAHARMVEPAAKAPCTCKDPDDQIFIDLAVAHRASLLSKDQAVLSMRKRLLASAVRATSAIDFVAQSFPPAPSANTA
jgi:predicted nucleic acid-binding protein